MSVVIEVAGVGVGSDISGGEKRHGFALVARFIPHRRRERDRGVVECDLVGRKHWEGRLPGCRPPRGSAWRRR